jgi:hypothetical protein
LQQSNSREASRFKIQNSEKYQIPNSNRNARTITRTRTRRQLFDEEEGGEVECGEGDFEARGAEGKAQGAGRGFEVGGEGADGMDLADREGETEGSRGDAVFEGGEFLDIEV